MAKHERKGSANVDEDQPWVEVHQDASLVAWGSGAVEDGSGVLARCQAADDRAIHRDAVKMATALTGWRAAIHGASVRNATNTDCRANNTITPMGAAHAARGMRPISAAAIMKNSRYPNV